MSGGTVGESVGRAFGELGDEVVWHELVDTLRATGVVHARHLIVADGTGSWVNGVGLTGLIALRNTSRGEKPRRLKPAARNAEGENRLTDSGWVRSDAVGQGPPCTTCFT